MAFRWLQQYTLSCVDLQINVGDNLDFEGGKMGGKVTVGGFGADSKIFHLGKGEEVWF